LVICWVSKQLDAFTSNSSHPHGEGGPVAYLTAGAGCISLLPQEGMRQTRFLRTRWFAKQLSLLHGGPARREANNRAEQGWAAKHARCSHSHRCL